LDIVPKVIFNVVRKRIVSGVVIAKRSVEIIMNVNDLTIFFKILLFNRIIKGIY
jgi:hypothetical protein